MDVRDPGRSGAAPRATHVAIGAARPAASMRLVPGAPTVSGELILRLQKYRDPRSAPQPIQDAAARVAAEASQLLAPDAVLWRGPVGELEPSGAVTLGDRCRLHSRALARLLNGCAEAYVVVLTVGAAIEERARDMLDAQLLLEGFLMDTAAWAALIAVARDIRRHLLDLERPAGRTVTHRLAPGYLDWPVSEQAALLGVFEDTPLPVHVTESAWMVPVKSLSGAFGVVSRR